MSLAAFIITMVAWLYRAALVSRKKLIDSAPETERARLVEDALEFLHINTDGLTRVQKYQLALEQIRARERRFRWTATIVGLIAVLLTLLSAYAIAKTTGTEPALQTEKLTPIRLVQEWTGFQDGQHQYTLGCPDGGFFAIRGPLPQNLSIPSLDSLPANVGWLAPMFLRLAAQSDLPSTDYVRITAINVNVNEYIPESAASPNLVVQRAACADADPGAGLLNYKVILPPPGSNLRLESLRQAGGAASAVIRQEEPVSIRLDITARTPGWYKFEVRMGYVHRQRNYEVQLDPVWAYFPGQSSYNWYSTGYDEGLRKLRSEEATQLQDELADWSVHGWPPKLAEPTDRSGPSNPPD